LPVTTLLIRKHGKTLSRNAKDVDVASVRIAADRLLLVATKHRRRVFPVVLDER